MYRFLPRLTMVLMLGIFALNLSAAESAATRDLIDVAAPGSEKRLAPSSSQVSVDPSTDLEKLGVIVSIAPGKDAFPGVSLKPESGAWNLADFGHVALRVTNTGEKSLSIALRLDNAGDWRDNPWNAESTFLKPGATGTVKVRFGYSFNKPGYALKSDAIAKVLIYAGKNDTNQSFRIESLTASGSPGEKPDVDPNTIRTRPVHGVLFDGASPNQAIDAGKQLTSRGGQLALHQAANRSVLRLTVPAGKGERGVVFKPALGRWDLSDHLQVQLKITNAGSTPVTPRARIESNGGPSSGVSTPAPIAPGATQELTIPFASNSIWNGQKNTGNQLTSQNVSAVAIYVEGESAAELHIDSIRASMPAPASLPDWLGKRPPVEGDWYKTFEDEFNGNDIDQTKWKYHGENYWDKKTHFSKDNVIVSGGTVRLRIEKKTGFHNDDPSRKQTDYATGFLETYGKWVQRYGYFEARLKPMTTPGVWPAFWMMPDRGEAAGPQWKRADTSNGGMEFDIFEQLTRWGPHRYNIAMHWDGYEKNHKHVGSDKIYAQPDKDGFITVGLLWTPGSLVYYCNGQVVARWDNPRVSTVPADLMFTLPVGGWDNDPLDDSKLPGEFIIDYVRCWQRTELATDADTVRTPVK